MTLSKTASSLKIETNISEPLDTIEVSDKADDIDIIGRCKRDGTAAFSAIQRVSEKVGLMANEGKTKYMLYSSRGAQLNQCQTEITADGYTFEAAKEFT